MADVMISYSRHDQEFSQQLVDTLRDKLFDVWVDWGNLPIGAEWWAEIETGIEISDSFICVISSRWFLSQICQAELRHAVQLKKRIIPIVLEQIDEKQLMQEIATQASVELVSIADPLALAQDNWKVVTRINWLFYDAGQAFDDFIVMLIDVINTDLEHVRRHTHYFQSAQKWDLRGRKAEYLLRGEELQEAIFWLENSAQKDPLPTELHIQFFLESQQEATKIQNALAHSIQTLSKRMLGLGPKKIFISYRRADSADVCGRIYDRLEKTFGAKNIFLDVTSIDFGADFAQFIQDTLKECFAVLVIIGPNWVRILNERLQTGESDYVQIEVESALKRHHINVIPLFVSDTSMPSDEDLPASMRALVMKNGTPIRAGREFHQDMDELINQLKKIRSEVKPNS